MKQTITISLCFFISFTLSAQYKKASFFSKQGRTHELGTNFSYLGSGQAAAVSIVYSGSLETSNKFSGFMDLELMLPSTLEYVAQYYVNGTPTSSLIMGKIPTALMIKYGVQYRFINPEKEEDTKWVPYARLGLLSGFIFSNDYQLKAVNGDEISADNISPAPPQDMSSFLGLEGGVGVTYYITKNLGLKVGGMYRQIFTFKQQDPGTFNPIDSHPGFTVAIKYRMFNED